MTEEISKDSIVVVPNVSDKESKTLRYHNVNKTIRELTSNKKRLSDANLTTNETIEFFTKIKTQSKRLKPIPLEKNPNYEKYNTYSPYDCNKLLQRIHTYSILNWTIEDENLNPLTCARHGWTNVDSKGVIKNQLLCNTCKATMIITLNESDKIDFSDMLSDDDEIYTDCNSELVAKYLLKLSSSHIESCPWKNYPTPLSTYSLQSHDHTESLKDLKDRVTYLDQNKASLANSHLLSVVGDEYIDPLQKWTNFEFDNDTLMICLLGWELQISNFGDSSMSLLYCKYCNRRLLLKEKGSGGDKDEDNIDGADSLDVIQEHKDWCAMKEGYKTLMNFV